MKKLILFFSFLFFLSFVTSNELKISPEEISFVGKPNELICNNVQIKVSNDSIITIKDRWAKKDFNKRDFKSHNLTNKDLSLEISYLSNINVKENSKAKICLTAKESGFYHGLLLFRKKESLSGIGIWMSVNISDKEKFSTLITGETISFNNTDNKELSITYLLIALFVLILILEIIFYLKKKIYS